MIAAPAVFADELASKPSFTMNVGVESFRWEEFSGGQRLLSETGPRLVVGFTLDRLLQGNQTNPYSAEARAYLGVVDYDGQTQSGVSAKTDVDYFGVSAEGMGGLRLAGSLRMDLLGGLGVDTWTRDIQDGVTANGAAALGYREDRRAGSHDSGRQSSLALCAHRRHNSLYRRIALPNCPMKTTLPQR